MCFQNSWKKNSEALLCSRPHPLPVVVNYLPFSVIFFFFSCQSLAVFNRAGAKDEAERGKREWEEGRMHLINTSLLSLAGCLRAAAPLCSPWKCDCRGGWRAKKRRAWETRALTFLNQIWQSGGQLTAYHLQFLLIHNQKRSKWGRNWEGGGGCAGHYISFYWPDESNVRLISGH